MSIYFIQCGGPKGPVKIGFSTNLRMRLSSLSMAHYKSLKLIGLMEGSKEDEQNLHKKFKHLLIKGEWFKYKEEIHRFVEQLPKNQKIPRNNVQLNLLVPIPLLNKVKKAATGAYSTTISKIVVRGIVLALKEMEHKK